MKFAEHLSAHITPEWRKQYVSYESMKPMLYDAIEQAPSSEMTDDDIIERYFKRFDESFIQYCDKELLKINMFFAEKLAEAKRKFSSLKSDLSTSETIHQNHHHIHLRRRKGPKLLSKDKSAPKHAIKKSMHDIKLAFSEFYLALILMQNYQSLNFTGFRKILKKHDKLLRNDRGAKWRQANVETAPFYTSKEVDHLIKETENVFTLQLEGGNRQKAMKRLRVPPLGEKQNPWATFRIGLFSGIFMVLLSVIIITVVFVAELPQEEWECALRIYRGVFLVMLCMSLLGINTYGWRTSGVNHVLIFELDPRDHITHQHLLEMACFLAVIWAMSVLAFLFSPEIRIPAMVNPLCLVAFCLLFLINPIHVMHFKARRWLLRVLLRILTAPFHHVGFADFWLADQLNSLTTVLLDIEYLLCYYAFEVKWLKHGLVSSGVCGTVKYGIRPIIACLPAWFRFAQCLRRYRDTRLIFPHIVNAGKYSTTFFVVLFSSLHSHYVFTMKEKAAETNVPYEGNSPFFYIWIIAAFISTCYTFTWDIKMDWGLLDKNAGENRFLREEIVYAHKWYYYFAMIEDWILRFAWTIAVSDTQWDFIHNEVLFSVLASLEVFRRFIWNFFRLENEHLNNCGQFRAVRDISISPLNTNDSAMLETMMDDDNGVMHRQKVPDGHRRLSRTHGHHGNATLSHAPWDLLTVGALSLSLSSLPGVHILSPQSFLLTPPSPTPKDVTVVMETDEDQELLSHPGSSSS